MSKSLRSDLVTLSDCKAANDSPNRQKFQFFERRSPVSQFRKAYSRNSTRSIQNHVPSLTLDESVIEKFEKAQHPLSKSVRRITDKKKELETPRSISNFILFSSSNADLVAMATVIQRNWRISLYKRKLRRFLNFILKIRRRRLLYALSMWILSTMPNQERAKKSYTSVCRSLQSYKFLIKKRKSLFIKSSKMRLLTFEEYMQTNILFSIYPGKILVKYHKNFNQQLIQKLFQAWFSIASEHLILSKANNQTLIFARYREIYGPEFWTYHVWKRWVYYKKQRKIELVETISSNIYVPEWTFFRAKKLTEARMRREATMHYRIRIGKQIIQVFRDEIHRRNTLKNSYERTVNYSNQLSLLYGYKAFQYIIIFRRFRQGCLIRFLRAWYTVIDSRILNRAKVSIFSQRIKLKLMRKHFKSWRKNIIEESVKNAFLHDQVSSNSLKLLPFVFLMKNNLVHFTYTMCFINWKKMIDKKKNLKRFVFWSIKSRKKQTLLRFVFDILKDNAHFALKKSTYLPFNTNPDQGNFTHVSSQQCIMCPTSSLPETINAYHNVVSYPMYQGDWSKFASASQIRTLFYRLVCLVSYKKNLNLRDTRDKKIKMIKEFIKKKNLFNQRQVKTVYQMNDKKDIEMKKEISNILNRDVHVITAYDAHSTALELSTQNPNFSVNDEMRMLKISSKKVENEEENLNEKNDEEEEEDVNEDTYSISSSSTQGSSFLFRKRKAKTFRYSTPSIPFLRPINEIKDSLMKMSSKFRRRPNDAFLLRTISNRKARNSFEMSSHRISAISSHLNGSFYEHYVQIQPSKSMIESMKNKNFSIKELQNLKRQITDAEIELEPIPELNEKIEVDEDVNDYYSYGEFEEEEEEIEPKNNGLKDDLLSENETIQESINISKSSSKDFTKVRIGINMKNEDEFIESDEENDNKSKEKVPLIVKPINENTSKVEEITQSLDNQMVAIDEMENHFINDGEYFDFNQSERVSLLSNQYIDVIHLLLGNSSRPQRTFAQAADDTMQESIPRTHVSKLLKRIAFKISKESQISRKSSQRFNENKEKKKRVKLFQDPDQQFQEELHPDGNTYQRSTCPEFAHVLFSGVKVLSNTPWQTETTTPENQTVPKPPSQTPSSLPSAENVVPGFDEEIPRDRSKESVGNTSRRRSRSNSLSRATSLFIEKNNEIKEAVKELIEDESIDDALKEQILDLIDKIATKYLKEEAERSKNKELTSFVDVDPESPSADDTSEESPIIHLKKSEKIQHFDERKFAAFDTESREKPPLHAFNGRRQAFYKDLALAIIECARFMSKKTIKHVDDIRNETSEFETLKFIKKVQQKQLNDARKAAEARSKKTVLLNLPKNNYDEPVFTAAGVTKWTPPHKVQPTVYYSARSQKLLNSNGFVKNKSLPPTAFSSAVSSSCASSLSSTSTVTITGTVDDSSVQVPLIEITKFDITTSPSSHHNHPKNQSLKGTSQPPTNLLSKTQPLQQKNNEADDSSALKRVLLSSTNRPKTQQSLMQKRIAMLKQQQQDEGNSKVSPKGGSAEKKARIRLSASFDRSKVRPASAKSDRNKKKKKIVTKTITTINEIPIPIPVPDPMSMNQSEKSLKRKPRFTKFESTEPEPQVEFQFKPKTARNLNTNKVKPLRPKWRPSTGQQVVKRSDVPYFIYVNPYVDQDSIEKKSDINNND